MRSRPMASQSEYAEYRSTPPERTWGARLSNEDVARLPIDRVETRYPNHAPVGGDRARAASSRTSAVFVSCIVVTIERQSSYRPTTLRHGCRRGSSVCKRIPMLLNSERTAGGVVPNAGDVYNLIAGLH